MARAADIEHLDHTGDAGFRITADSLPLLFTTCAEQMVLLHCPDSTIRRSVARPVRATGHDLVELLVNWLTEINSLMAVHHELYDSFHIDSLEPDDKDSSPDGDAGENQPPCRLSGSAQGEPFDPDRHHIAQEIKAVTFGEAFVRAEADRWQCQVIFDL